MCLMYFVPIVKPFLTHWSWLQFVLFSWYGNRAHGGCDRSTGDAYSSYTLKSTSGMFRDPCLPHSLICISYRTYAITLISFYIFHRSKYKFYYSLFSPFSYFILTPWKHYFKMIQLEQTLPDLPWTGLCTLWPSIRKYSPNVRRK
jgi:hypothetical protein